MNLKKCVILLFLITETFLFADEITKVLQNGLNGYNDCMDSYVYRKGDDPSSVDQNFGDNPYLMTAN